MDHILTIGMPTFDRASLLDRQLAWFARAVVGREHMVELIVSDNCSTDETPEVTTRWQADLAARGIRARFVRNDENVGAIRNIVGCIDAAEGSYVWIVGDDDRIDPGALRFVLDTIDGHPDLALLVLNFSSRHVKTGFRRYERCFEIDEDLVEPTGTAIVERLLADPASVALGRSRPHHRPRLPHGRRPGRGPRVAGGDRQHHAAALPDRVERHAGTTIVTKEPHLEMSTGSHFFEEDPLVFFRFRIAEVPEAFVKLVELGYSRELCREKIRNQRRELRWRRMASLLRRQPWQTVDVLSRHLRASRAVEQVPSLPPQAAEPDPTVVASPGVRRGARSTAPLATHARVRQARRRDGLGLE
jgi:abequosyltransferase